jgi:cytoskeletal protein CcmA (bactofilin family)
MIKKRIKKILLNKTHGAATMMLVFFFMFISITLLIGIVGPAVKEFKIATNLLNSRQSYFSSESGVEDAMYRIKNNRIIGVTETISMGNVVSTTIISNLSSNKKEITSIGDKNSLNRKSNVVLSVGSGASFNYGLQVGAGGLDISGGTTIDGSVYVNGDITTHSANIKGDVFAASVSDVSPNVSNVGPVAPTSFVALGSGAAENYYQIFTPTATGPLKRVSLYLKTSTNYVPYTLGVKIFSNNNGVPGSQIGSTSNINNYFNTSSYNWVNADFTNVNVSAGTSYWIALSSPYSPWNQYHYATTAGGAMRYNSNAFSPASSGYYKIYVNNLPSSVSGVYQGALSVTPGDASGNVYANHVAGVTASGNIYCQSGILNNKTCNTTLPDPIAIDFPISSETIDEWKASAASGGVTNGNVTFSGTSSLGPRKIVGNLTVTGNLTVNGNIWVTGNISVSNGGKIRLNSNFGANDGIIVADGQISLLGGAEVLGSGNPDSFLVLVTTDNRIHTSMVPSSFAASVNNGAKLDALYAPNGDVWLLGGAEVKAVSSYKMSISNGGQIKFNSGLYNVTPPSGLGVGAWSISEWKERE